MKIFIPIMMLIPPLQVANKPLTDLLAAIRQVESSGNDQAVGDNGKALGPYQIWQPYWQDACILGMVGWKYCRTNAFNEPKARQVVIWYWLRYAPSNPCSAEILARIHNGGPKGYKKKSTLEYWRKVKIEINIHD